MEAELKSHRETVVYRPIGDQHSQHPASSSEVLLSFTSPQPSAEASRKVLLSMNGAKTVSVGEHGLVSCYSVSELTPVSISLNLNGGYKFLIISILYRLKGAPFHKDTEGFSHK